MFDGSDYPAALDGEQFAEWLEAGRMSKISYSHLFIIWDAMDALYKPVYAEQRNEIEEYALYPEAKGYESLVAAYDLFSESRVR